MTHQSKMLERIGELFPSSKIEAYKQISLELIISQFREMGVEISWQAIENHEELTDGELLVQSIKYPSDIEEYSDIGVIPFATFNYPMLVKKFRVEDKAIDFLVRENIGFFDEDVIIISLNTRFAYLFSKNGKYANVRW